MQPCHTHSGRDLPHASVSSVAIHARIALCALALVCAGVAGAETLGDARQLSRLGEPLRLAIPVRPDGGPPLTERCLGVVSSRESDGLPHILTGNVAVQREAGAGTVLVTTAAPMREPVSRLVIRTSCDGTSRQYTLFLEPAGSTRQVRAVSQPGPRVAGGQAPGALADPAAVVPAPAAVAVPPPTPGAGVTVIPVVPAPRATPPGARNPTRGEDTGVKAASNAKGSALSAPSPAIGQATASNLAQTGTNDGIAAGGSPGILSVPGSPSMEAPRSGIATPANPEVPPAAALEVENQNLKQQLADLSNELQRLQLAAPPTRPRAPLALNADARTSTPAAPAPRWEVAWPMLVALAGLAALTVGGFMWRRRHNAGDEWALTGPPSHRVASRTSLSEEPVTFRQAGVRADAPTDDAHAVALSIPVPPRDRRAVGAPPASLRLQPSTEDLARELEQELFVAERAHSALERAHPDIVDALTRSWGTAAARQQLASLLQVGSAELARMSGEAVAELRLLLRIADDANPRPSPEPYPPSTLSPPAPAW